MFAINDYVFYGSGGVCQIIDIQYAPLDGMPKDRQYYILHSIHEKNSMMYIPVDSEGVFLRSLISRAEAEDLVKQIPAVEVVEASNAKALRDKYYELMKMHAPIEWVRVMKTVQHRMNEPRQIPRKISETERSFLENARKYLYAELSIVLGIPLGEVAQYIADHTI